MENRNVDSYGEKIASEEFFKKKDEQYEKGKKIVKVVMIISIVSAVLSFFLDIKKIFSSIVGVALAIALYRGVGFVRWLYVVTNVIACVLDVMAIVGLVSVSLHPVLFWVMAIILGADAIYNIVCFNLLRGEAVSEFLYSQKNG